MRAYLVDDEQLALNRLSRLLAETKRVEIAGMSTDPVDACAAIEALQPDLLFLDIEMPGLSGFELLAKLESQPLVVFTTAYDQYALRAFGVNSIDYLLKPVSPEHLERALDKIDRIRAGTDRRPAIEELLAQFKTYPERLASRVGDRIEFVDLAGVSHFYAEDKLTFASAAAKNYVVDFTIQQLEQKLNPKSFLRIHRSTLLNLAFVHELHTFFGGRLVVKLNDAKRSELTVARDRVRVLKDKLGIS